MEIAVTMNTQILCPVLLICWMFMPKTEEARLVGTNANARTVTGKSQLNCILVMV